MPYSPSLQSQVELVQRNRETCANDGNFDEFSRNQHRQELAAALVTLGRLYKENNDGKAALECWQEAIRLSQQTHDNRKEALIYSMIGEYYSTNLHDYASAADYLEQAAKASDDLRTISEYRRQALDYANKAKR